MSDLDADLYGGKSSFLDPPPSSLTLVLFADLYGNDESEFAVPTEPEEADKSDPVENEELEEEVSLPQQAAPAHSSAAPTETSKPAQPAPIAQDTAPLSPSASTTPAQSQVPVYTSPTTQQIPTYQERQDDYADMGASRPAQDRPVRPSEMKEEG